MAKRAGIVLFFALILGGCVYVSAPQLGRLPTGAVVVEVNFVWTWGQGQRHTWHPEGIERELGVAAEHAPSDD